MTKIDIPGWSPPHVSYSTINGWRECGKRTFLQKVARVEQRPGLAAIGGNAVHTATEEIDKLIWEHGLEILDDEPEAPVAEMENSQPDQPPF